MIKNDKNEDSNNYIKRLLKIIFAVFLVFFFIYICNASQTFLSACSTNMEINEGNNFPFIKLSSNKNTCIEDIRVTDTYGNNIHMQDETRDYIDLPYSSEYKNGLENFTVVSLMNEPSLKNLSINKNKAEQSTFNVNNDLRQLSIPLNKCKPKKGCYIGVNAKILEENGSSNGEYVITDNAIFTYYFITIYLNDEKNEKDEYILYLAENKGSYHSYITSLEHYSDSNFQSFF